MLKAKAVNQDQIRLIVNNLQILIHLIQVVKTLNMNVEEKNQKARL